MKTTNTNIIFSQVKKRLPFRIPDEYFENSERKLRAIHQGNLHKRIMRYGIVASILLAIGLWYLIQFELPIDSSSNEQICSLTYTNDNDWFDFAEADIFLDNMDW